jgi:hypothetical protein
MTLSAPLAAVALAAGLSLPDGPTDATGLPPPDLEARWAEAAGLHFFHRFLSLPGSRPDGALMIDAILTGRMGPTEGWFGPSQGRLGWPWLAARLDADGDGRVTREEFTGPDELFDRLDRDGDGVLTAADFDWSPKPPAASKGAKSGGGMPPPELLLRALFRGDLGSPYEGPRIGQRAPRFVLPRHDGSGTVALADLIGHKPVVLIFGSFT